MGLDLLRLFGSPTTATASVPAAGGPPTRVAGSVACAYTVVGAAGCGGAKPVRGAAEADVEVTIGRGGEGAAASAAANAAADALDVAAKESSASCDPASACFGAPAAAPAGLSP